jgi:solute carrier family 25 oxoglutarate transporter 11
MPASRVHSARLGFFDAFINSLTTCAKESGNKIGFVERAGAGLSAGGLAALLGNPADLALIRIDAIRWPETSCQAKEL